jgi:hypothetical protein
MSGGTLTPPRNPTWDTGELVAPVIPFRQRGEQPDRPIPDDRKARTPIVAAPADKPGSSWIHQGNGLLAQHAAAAQLEEDVNTTRRRPSRRLLAVAVIAAAAVLTPLALLHLGAPAGSRNQMRIETRHVSQPAAGSLPSGWVSGLLAAVRAARSLESSAQRTHKAATPRHAHRAPAVHRTTAGTVVATSSATPPSVSPASAAGSSSSCAPWVLGC